MFDLTRVTEMIGGFLGQQSAGAMINDLLADKLAALNIDPAMLNDLGAPEIMNLLAQQGIELSQLDPAQLTQLIGQLDAQSPAADLLNRILSQHGSQG